MSALSDRCHDHSHEHEHSHAHDHSNTNEHSSNHRERDEEAEHWHTVLRTFLCYEDFVEFELARRQTHFNRLPEQFIARLPEATFDKFAAVYNATQRNQRFFEDMVAFHVQNTYDPSDELPSKERGCRIRGEQQHRNQAVLHSLYREWSAAGAEERASTFDPILAELKTNLPVSEKELFKQRVLVPGCGVGRLPIEIASMGYSCEGNEYSAFMLVASNFVLNGMHEKHEYDIFPWVENVCNVFKMSDTLQSCAVPDTTAYSLLCKLEQQGDVDNEAKYDKEQQPQWDYPKFSMSAGDFNEIYGGSKNKEQWDCVVTCFFLDTAPVVMEYIETIFSALRPGGIWINLGPLLYHWAAEVETGGDERYSKSIELSFEEVKHVISTYGFEFLKEQRLECQYTCCSSAMMQTVYKPVLFTAKKPLVSTASTTTTTTTSTSSVATAASSSTALAATAAATTVK